MDPEALPRQSPLLHQILVVLLRQIQTNNFDFLFAHFVINTKAIWNKVFHCIGQVACATKKFQAEKS